MRRIRRQIARALLVLAMGVGMAQAQDATVTGTVGYLERIALPPGAVMDVRLLDISRQDVAASVLSARRFAMTGVPQPFTLLYDAALIDPRHIYGLRAEIRREGEVLFRSTQVTPVLTREAPDYADLILQRAAAAPAGSELVGTEWVVEAVGGRALVAEPPPTVAFPEPGRAAVYAGCNRFTGQVEAGAGTLRFAATMAGTRMACPPERMRLETDMLEALGEVTGFTRTESGGLSLTNAAGVTVLSLRPAG